MAAKMAVSGVKMSQAQEEVWVISFFILIFCFVSIVLMYEWLNMKIKRNVDRFSGFLKMNDREKFFLGFIEKMLGFTEKH